MDRMQYFKQIALRLLGSGLVAATVLAVSACSGLDQIAEEQPANRNMIFLGDSTILVPQGSREQRRYTCGPHGYVYCENFGPHLSCQCARR